MTAKAATRQQRVVREGADDEACSHEEAGDDDVKAALACRVGVRGGEEHGHGSEETEDGKDRTDRADGKAR